MSIAQTSKAETIQERYKYIAAKRYMNVTDTPLKRNGNEPLHKLSLTQEDSNYLKQHISRMTEDQEMRKKERERS